MTKSSRREQIESMLADDPQDQFLRYGLAMEMQKEGEHEHSLELLETLTHDDPPLIAAFFMAGQQWTRMKDFVAAREVLRRGIDVARAQNDSHAASEMSEYLARLGDLGE